MHSVGPLFLSIACLICWTSATPHMARYMNKRDIFCGSRLTDVLAAVCRGRYNSPVKKSLEDLFVNYNAYEEGYPMENDLDDTDFLGNGIETMDRFRRSGIVDECCRNPCTLKHLSLYCA